MIKIKLVQVSKSLFKLSKLLLLIFLILTLISELGDYLFSIHVFSRNFSDLFDSVFYSIASVFVFVLEKITVPIFFITFFIFIISLLKYIIFKLSKKEDSQKKSEIKKTIVYSGVTMCLALAFYLSFSFIFIEEPMMSTPPIPGITG